MGCDRVANKLCQLTHLARLRQGRISRSHREIDGCETASHRCMTNNWSSREEVRNGRTRFCDLRVRKHKRVVDVAGSNLLERREENPSWWKPHEPCEELLVRTRIETGDSEIGPCALAALLAPLRVVFPVAASPSVPFEGEFAGRRPIVQLRSPPRSVRRSGVNCTSISGPVCSSGTTSNPIMRSSRGKLCARRARR